MALVGEGRKVGALGFGASCGSEAAILLWPGQPLWTLVRPASRGRGRRLTEWWEYLYAVLYAGGGQAGGGGWLTCVCGGRLGIKQ